MAAEPPRRRCASVGVSTGGAEKLEAKGARRRRRGKFDVELFSENVDEVEAPE